MITSKLCISVAMCTYNGNQFLPEQLTSIVAQTRLPDELVICDDGSTDATSEIVEEFGRVAPFPVRFFRNPENLGSTKNFEKAIGLCTGDLIALSDQDDIWLPERLARQAEMMENHLELGGVFSDAELIDDHSQPVGKRLWPLFGFTPAKQSKFRAGKANEILLSRNVVTGATFMVRAKLRPVFSDIPKSWFHDGWIAWMLALYSKLDFIEDPLIYYRIHTSQSAGIENFSLGGQSTLLARLVKGKREEPAKQLKHMRDLEQLEQRLALCHDKKTLAASKDVQRKICFFRERGTQYSSRLARISWILQNTSNYYRYENGWKCLMRDLVLVFV